MIVEFVGSLLVDFNVVCECIWIVECDGVFVGFIVLVDGGEQVGKLCLFYVDEVVWGFGFGSCLVDECIVFVFFVGYWKISFWINDNFMVVCSLYV